MLAKYSREERLAALTRALARTAHLLIFVLLQLEAQGVVHIVNLLLGGAALARSRSGALARSGSARLGGGCDDACSITALAQFLDMLTRYVNEALAR
jgi:hypothetical protein